MNDKVLKVSAIKNGTVIDHIPADSLFKVISILGLKKLKTHMSFGTNYESKKLGFKSIIKLSDIYLVDEDINKIALVAPLAKINIIKDYDVQEKKPVEVPENIIGIVKCVNPMCITNNEHVTTKFKLLSSNDLKMKCHYCEKITDKEHMTILK